MSSRFLPSNPNPNWALFLSFTISASAVFLFALVVFLFYLLYSLIRRSRTIPFDPNTPSKLQKFSYKDLKFATNSFNEANLIGKGGSGTVFRGLVRDGKSVAVKKLDASMLQVELEFQNELHILGSLKSDFVVPLLGHCVEKKWRFLVYEFMPNGSLQGLLFGERSKALDLNWERRFGIILDVVRGLEFLHLECVPPVIHGDIKPGNVLLGSDYRAKISDFGLSREKIEGEIKIDMLSQEFRPSTEVSNSATVIPKDTSRNRIPLESSTTEVDSNLSLQASSKLNVNLSHPNFVNDDDVKGRKLNGKDAHIANIGGEDWKKFFSCSGEPCSVDSVNPESRTIGKTWGNNGSGELHRKDHDMEWVGSQILGNLHCDESAYSEQPELDVCAQSDKSENTSKPQFEELMKMSEMKEAEGGLQVISKKQKLCKLKAKWKKRFKIPHPSVVQFRECCMFCKRNQNYRGTNAEFNLQNGRKHMRTNSSNSEMWSGEFLSRELSSSTSMRGTMFYVAPEHRGCGHLTEKSDIYSLGVLILVIVSGRRPLHVLSSPVKLKKASLVSWCKHLARSGNVMDLVDAKLKDRYNKEQARLCINLALLCLQKTPELRPGIDGIVKILKGEKDLPDTPLEFEPLSTSKRFSRSGRKAKLDLE